MAGSFSTDGDWTGTRHPHDVHTSEPGCISEPQLGQNISTSSSVARRRKNPVLAWGVRYQFRNRQSTTGGHPHRFQSHFLHGATTRLVSDGRHVSFDPERRGGLRSSLFEIRDRPATGPNQGRGTRTVRLRRGRFATRPVPAGEQDVWVIQDLCGSTCSRCDGSQSDGTIELGESVRSRQVRDLYKRMRNRCNRFQPRSSTMSDSWEEGADLSKCDSNPAHPQRIVRVSCDLPPFTPCAECPTLDSLSLRSS